MIEESAFDKFIEDGTGHGASKRISAEGRRMSSWDQRGGQPSRGTHRADWDSSAK